MINEQGGLAPAREEGQTQKVRAMKIKMHRIEIADLCQRAGFTNARQLQGATGMGMESVYHLWSGKAVMIRLETLDLLTNLLGCKVEDIIRVEEIDEEDLEVKNGEG